MAFLKDHQRPVFKTKINIKAIAEVVITVNSAGKMTRHRVTSVKSQVLPVPVNYLSLFVCLFPNETETSYKLL